jgi:hypothetical protein
MQLLAANNELYQKDDVRLAESKGLLKLVLLMILIYIFCEVLSLTGIAIPPHKTVLYAMVYESWPPFSLAFFGGYIIFLSATPTTMENFITIIAGIIIGIILITIYKKPEPIGNLLIIGSAGLGMASIISLAVKIGRTGFTEPALISSFSFSVGLPIFLVIMNFFHQVHIYLNPQTYDYYLYAFDGTLGLQASFWLGRILAKSSYLTNFCKLFYAGLPLAIVFICALEFQVRQGSYLNMLKVFIITGVIGFFLYDLYPAAGPLYRFGSFPQAPVTAQIILEPAPLGTAARNAMPSLHMAWALLIWWNAQQHTRLIRLAAGFFLFFTILSTLGLGEHYLIDLIVAVPFAVAMQALCTNSLPFFSKPRFTTVLL